MPGRLTLGASVVIFALMISSVLNSVTAEAEVGRSPDTGVPPPGGITVVRAGSTDLGQIVQAAPFGVESIYAYDIGPQRFLSFTPGVPAFVNTLHSSDLSPDTLVWLKRPKNDRDQTTASVLPAEAGITGPRALPPPSRGGLTVGPVGTTSLRPFVEAQRFGVASVWVFDVASQRFRTYHMGTPSMLNTLSLDAHIEPSTVVWLRRSPTDPAPVDVGSQRVLAGTNPASSPSLPPFLTSAPSPAATATPTSTPVPQVRASGLPATPTSSSNSGCPTIPQDRLTLLDGRVGFGARASGGANGCQYVVTNLKDSGAGSLREGATEGNRWIVFNVSGTITLSSPIQVASDTTIDGRGARIEIRKHGLNMIEKQNVIVSHVTINGAADDGIQIRRQSTRDIWVNHVTINDVADGYIDITQGATNVTVSWSRFDPSPSREREKVMLIGADDPGDRDDLTNVTLHHNFFNNTEQRNPLIRAGYVHSYNNYITGWNIYATGVGSAGRLLSERNIYDYGGHHRARAFVPWGSGDASIRSTGDLFLSGASGDESDVEGVSAPPYSYRAATADDSLRSQIMSQAGNR